ncbi:hypothetical protein MEA186_31386 [Mesorhizobium amorphae CCNWGS0123]|uniref:Uncharacterized protein n=1 Tax=Mesorhizobium amorphae CCNWGS0123 TaxID=1082933 RepID=G6YJU3_9HYPH|nr:hypothetical protein MEA186_31386 [Mesorhizobium amorphae CCNWGS0123]
MQHLHGSHVASIFFVIIDIFVKLLGLYDRTLRRRYMAGFSSPLLANFRAA